MGVPEFQTDVPDVRRSGSAGSGQRNGPTEKETEKAGAVAIESVLEFERS